jgi:ankyrin repeat protein
MMSPLHVSSDKSNPDALMGMEFCVASGANINLRDGTGTTPLHYACHHAQFNYTTRMIRLLLNKGADPNIYDDQ